MLYLFIGAILAIGVKSQTLTPACSVDGDCDASIGTGVCGTLTVAGFTQKTCIPCATDADCTSSSYYTTLYGGADNLECSDPLSVGVDACYPPYCGTGGVTCATGYECISDYCIASTFSGGCSSDSDCSTGETCYTQSSVGVCITGSLGCSSDSDCDSGESCYTQSGISVCISASLCTKDADCSDPTPTCATDYGICYLGCSSDSDCTSLDSSFTCQTDITSGLSGCGAPECSADSDCWSTETCNDGSCVECVTADDCSTDESCTANTCVASTCSADADCAGSYICSSGKECVLCETDDDCTTGLTCQTYNGYNVCSAGDLTTDDGINQITTYVAMIIMAFVAINM